MTDEIALIQTVDFFTPIVDDPYSFGQIAAANALSDVYAMGGAPKTAMNIVAFPRKTMDISVLRAIIEGGISKLREAGVALAGGHSIEDKELKYGLSVTGFVHPKRILTKRNLREGDRLIMTKPLGTGIVNTAIKGGIASEAVVAAVTRQMIELNKTAAEVMSEFPVNACTDITGFGLLGHAAEMVTGTGLGIEFDMHSIPVIPEALEYAGCGMVPGGTGRNREFRECMCRFDHCVDDIFRDVLFDPQTSGGLLISVEAAAADNLLAALRSKGVSNATLVGRIVSEPKDKLIVT